MGCGTTKVRPEIDINQLSSSMTDQERKLVMDTLPLLTDDMQGAGLLIFKK